MLKSPVSLGKRLDLDMCWRFFLYKLVLEETIHKFKRDTEYLTQSAQATNSPWKLACDIEKIRERIGRIEPDMESLRKPLEEITQMISCQELSCLLIIRLQCHVHQRS